MTQTAVQGVVWLADASLEIAQVKWSAYFVNTGDLDDADTKRFYVVMPLTAEFRERYDGAWRRLTKAESFRLALFDETDETPEGEWYVSISWSSSTHSLGLIIFK